LQRVEDTSQFAYEVGDGTIIDRIGELADISTGTEESTRPSQNDCFAGRIVEQSTQSIGYRMDGFSRESIPRDFSRECDERDPII
jgi:hypothetical protein